VRARRGDAPAPAPSGPQTATPAGDGAEGRDRHAAAGRDRALVLGSGEFACRLVDAMTRARRPRGTIAGIVADTAPAPDEVCGIPVLGTAADLTRIVAQTGATRVIVAVTDRRARLPVRQLLDCGLRGIDVEEGVEIYEHLTGTVAIEFLTPSDLFLSRRFGRATAHDRAARVLSAAAALAGLIVLSPLLALIAIAIRLDSPGPIFFIQDRVGLNGRPFRLIKFRSMHPASHRRSEWACDNRDRVTRVGRLMRKFWLDELPELWNILRGDMNLIGPRPHPVSNWMLFEMVLRNTPQHGQRIPYCSLRTKVRPGLSGWAQVRYGYANNLEEEVEKVKYDLYYVKYRSLWLDLRVLLLTIRLCITGTGTAALEAEPRRAVPLEAADSLRVQG
jgi:exopolysaccharide biosynthesis polyprenyl glycosylphosphotransferase